MSQTLNTVGLMHLFAQMYDADRRAEALNPVGLTRIKDNGGWQVIIAGC